MWFAGVSRVSAGAEPLAALNALANALRHVAPVQVLCDLTDIRAHANLRSPFSDCPAIFLYETYPGGVGFSEKLFTHHERLLEAAISLLSDCPCTAGCPSCVGSALEAGAHGKQSALHLAHMALGKEFKEEGQMDKAS